MTNILIEALDLQIAYPTKEKRSIHKCGPMSEPESIFWNAGSIVKNYHYSQWNLKRGESADIISSILPQLMGGIPPSPMKEVSENSCLTCSEIVNNNSSVSVKNVILQTCNKIDFLHTKMVSESVQKSLDENCEKDHLVPQKNLSWEDDQESLDVFWNEMSSSQKVVKQFQNDVKSTNSAAISLCANDAARQLPNEIDAFNVSLSQTPSTEEIEGSNELFSQIFLQKIQSKKEKKKLFVKKHLHPCSQVLHKTSFNTQFSTSRVISYSQNDKRDGFQRFAKIPCSKSPAEVCDENDEELDATASQSTQSNESKVVSYSQNDNQDAFERSTKLMFSMSPTEIIDINDEEIDAAIENYENTQNEMLAVIDSENSAGSQADPQKLESIMLLDVKVDVGTQTSISGSIYSSAIKCGCVEKSTPLKRNLKALCLESYLKKPRMTIFLSPNGNFTSQQFAEDVAEIGETPNEVFEAVAYCRPMKTSSKNVITYEIDESNEAFQQNEEEQNEFFEPNGEKEKDPEYDQTERCSNELLQDQEVPRSTPVIGMLPIHPPANFYWHNDRPECGGNDASDLIDQDAPTKPNLKAQCRLRIGLSKRAKPRLSLHRPQQ